MNINNIDLKNGFKMIEASAGTGKTFTLSHLALKKIIEDRVDPEDILIITYTKKAANDLRDKIIELSLIHITEPTRPSTNAYADY